MITYLKSKNKKEYEDKILNAEEKIYEAYLKLKFDRLYFNQLKEFTQLSNSSLQNALNKFVKNRL